MKYKDDTRGLGSVVNTGSFLSPSVLVVNMHNISTSGHTFVLLMSVTLLHVGLKLTEVSWKRAEHRSAPFLFALL